MLWKVAVPKSSCSEKKTFQKKASLIDNLKWKFYSGRELLRITAIVERIVKTYEECFWVVQKPLNYRQSCTEAATGDGLITFAKFTGKNLSQSFFFNKVVGLRLATILKERLWYRCFPINFTKKNTHFEKHV